MEYRVASPEPAILVRPLPAYAQPPKVGLRFRHAFRLQSQNGLRPPDTLTGQRGRSSTGRDEQQGEERKEQQCINRSVDKPVHRNECSCPPKTCQIISCRSHIGSHFPARAPGAIFFPNWPALSRLHQHPEQMGDGGRPVHAHGEFFFSCSKMKQDSVSPVILYIRNLRVG
jgi:hypothetical protein